MRLAARLVPIVALVFAGLLSAPFAGDAAATSCAPPAGTFGIRGYLSVYQGVNYTGTCDYYSVKTGYYNLPAVGRRGVTIHDNGIRSVKLHVGTSADWYGRLYACTGLNLTGSCFSTLTSIADLASTLVPGTTTSFTAAISSFRVQSVRIWNGYGDSCQCTWAAASLMNLYLSPSQHPKAYPGWRGDAGQWGAVAAATGWATGTTPRVSSVASWPAGYYPHGSVANDPRAVAYWAVGIVSSSTRVGHASWVVGVSADGRWVHVKETGSCGRIVDGGWYGVTGHVGRSQTSTAVHPTFIYPNR